MGPTARLQSAPEFLGRPDEIKYRKDHQGPKGEHLWECQSFSQKQSTLYCVSLTRKGATRTDVSDSEDVLTCDCPGLYAIVNALKPKLTETCLHCIGVSMMITRHHALF